LDDLTIVIPSYNESHEIIRKTVTELKSIGAEVIVVDDGSDEPYPDAIKHGANFGYGSALMTGIKNATRPLILTADGDGQHQVSEIVKLYHAFKLMGNADMVIGVRRLENESVTRFIGRKLLNWTASLICTYWISDLNSGLRIFRRDIGISYFPILCRTFSFTTSLTISMMTDKRRVEFFPINVIDRAVGKSRVKLVKDGITTLYYILRNGFALRTRGIRAFLRQFKVWLWLTRKA
jgi:glycosyltransferase involved in cell wall biosynthesis